MRYQSLFLVPITVLSIQLQITYVGLTHLSLCVLVRFWKWGRHISSHERRLLIIIQRWNFIEKYEIGNSFSNSSDISSSRSLEIGSYFRINQFQLVRLWGCFNCFQYRVTRWLNQKSIKSPSMKTNNDQRERNKLVGVYSEILIME